MVLLAAMRLRLLLAFLLVKVWQVPSNPSTPLPKKICPDVCWRIERADSHREAFHPLATTTTTTSKSAFTTNLPIAPCHRKQIADANADAAFITEVFHGCVRFKKLIAVVVNGFFARHGPQVLRSDRCLYVSPHPRSRCGHRPRQRTTMPLARVAILCYLPTAV